MKLLAFANHTDYSLIEKQRLLTNIDQYDTVDADIDELIIKPWCSRFCPRCYTYKLDYCIFVKLIFLFCCCLI